MSWHVDEVHWTASDLNVKYISEKFSLIYSVWISDWFEIYKFQNGLYLM